MKEVKDDSQYGQATIEFLFAFLVGFGFFLIFVGLAMNFASSYVNQYVTFMASRVYLSSDGTNSPYENAKRKAREAVDRYVSLDSHGDLRVSSQGLKFYSRNDDQSIIPEQEGSLNKF